jgi:hypothetical protein
MKLNISLHQTPEGSLLIAEHHGGAGELAVMGKIMKKFILIYIFLLSITLFSCARLDRIYTLPEIKGAYEGIQFGYYYLEIKEDGKGYLIYSLSDEAEDPYVITDINFLKGKFILTLQKDHESDYLMKLEGTLFGENILILTEPDIVNKEESNNPEEYLILLRESIVPELKKSVKEKLKELQEENT